MLDCNTAVRFAELDRRDDADLSYAQPTVLMPAASRSFEFLPSAAMQSAALIVR